LLAVVVLAVAEGTVSFTDKAAVAAQLFHETFRSMKVQQF
jgi:hypothetical protein